jgi:hypothetical protein
MTPLSYSYAQIIYVRASRVPTFELSVVTNITTQFVPYYDKNSLNFPLLPL